MNEVEITTDIFFAWVGTQDPDRDLEIIGDWFFSETGMRRLGKDCRTLSPEGQALAFAKWTYGARKRLGVFAKLTLGMNLEEAEAARNKIWHKA